MKAEFIFPLGDLPADFTLPEHVVRGVPEVAMH